MIYLLDTNILIAYLRIPNPLKEAVDKLYAPLDYPNEAIISVVTVGEIKSIALQNRWGDRRLRKLDETLRKLIIADVNTENIINAYAEIDAFSQGRLDGKLLSMSARNMGKNDLWIAATASVLDATLLTTDNDFDHLHEEFFEIGKIDISF